MKPAKAILADLERRDLLELVADCAKRHGALVEEVVSRSHVPRVSRARQSVWYALWCHSEANWSHSDIGRLFGRDHSTILSGVRAYARWLASRRENGSEGAEAVAAE